MYRFTSEALPFDSMWFPTCSLKLPCTLLSFPPFSPSSPGVDPSRVTTQKYEQVQASWTHGNEGTRYRYSTRKGDHHARPVKERQGWTATYDQALIDRRSRLPCDSFVPVEPKKSALFVSSNFDSLFVQYPLFRCRTLIPLRAIGEFIGYPRGE